VTGLRFGTSNYTLKKQKDDPPAHLSDRSAALWGELAPKHARSPGRRVLLESAPEALDHADAAREIIARECVTFTTEKTGTVHAHPALQIERQARTQFTRIWAKLALHWDAELDSQL
jgi:phage terminase small subunit